MSSQGDQIPHRFAQPWVSNPRPGFASGRTAIRSFGEAGPRPCRREARAPRLATPDRPPSPSVIWKFDPFWTNSVTGRPALFLQENGVSRCRPLRGLGATVRPPSPSAPMTTLGWGSRTGWPRQRRDGAASLHPLSKGGLPRPSDSDIRSMLTPRSGVDPAQGRRRPALAEAP
jgi:hypothetical protein